MKWALVVALGGVVLGVVAGAWLGQMIIELYNQFFRFPELLYRLSIDVVFGAAALTLAAAAARRRFRRPSGGAHPAGGSDAARAAGHGIAGWPSRRRGWCRSLSTASLHGVSQRHAPAIPGAGRRSPGLRMAVAILVVGFVFIDAMDQLITTQFSVAERQDVTVTFVEPRSADARHALSTLPGVIAVEPQRSSLPRARGPPAPRRRGHRRAARSTAAAHRRSRRPGDPDAGRGARALATAGQRARRRARGLRDDGSPRRRSGPCDR